VRYEPKDKKNVGVPIRQHRRPEAAEPFDKLRTGMDIQLFMGIPDKINYSMN